MSKVEWIKSKFKEPREIRGTIRRTLGSGTQFQDFWGMKAFIDGDGLVLEGLGIKLNLSSPDVEVVDDRYIMIETRFPEGPATVSIDLNQVAN